MSRLPYETPELRPLAASLAGRADPWRRPPACPTLGRHRVDDLAARFGTPLVVFDEPALRAAYRRFFAAFRAQWERTRVAWSVKTNYLSAVIAVFREEGALGEVVSGFEYAVCRDLGIPPGEIVFNGPWKSDAEIATALADGARVNIDGDDELERVVRLSRVLGRPAAVGIRVNVRLSHPPWDKFGFGLESGHALAAARRLAREPGLALEALHVHIGTYVPDAAQHGKAAEALIAFGLRLERELGLTIRVLDVGGGFATRNTLRHALLPGEATSASPEEYAEAVAKPVREAASQFREPPLLVVEPGRALVDEAASMITAVRAIKRGTGATKAAVLDAGVHVLPTAFWYRHEVRPVADQGQAVESYRLVGPLCMQIDVVRDETALPALRAGDLLVVRDVGAYNFSQSMQFIQLRPAYVMLRDDEVHLVRAPETPAAVRALERLPEHLVNAETAGSMLATAPAAESRRPGREPAADLDPSRA